MSQIVLDPDAIDGDLSQARWMVLIFNNDTNSMDEVVDILMVATGCELEEALIETWEADTYGKASVHFSGDRSECDGIATTISSIGVKTQVTPEWEV